MYKLFALAAAATITLTGCVIRTDDNRFDDDVIVVPENIAPSIITAESGVYYDALNADDIWYFEADVDDVDGVYDVIAVWADVYDDYDNTLVESFELFPIDGEPNIWFSDWLGSTTLLDATYTGYSVDIVAYDTYDAEDAVTVLPYYY